MADRRHIIVGDDFADKSEALAMDRSDQVLGLAIVAQRLTGTFYAARDGTVADCATIPNCFDQLILANEAISVLNKDKNQR
jgi:hypothetical protein